MWAFYPAPPPLYINFISIGSPPFNDKSPSVSRKAFWSIAYSPYNK